MKRIPMRIVWYVIQAFTLLEERRKKKFPRCINRFERSVSSMHGEDGILEHLIDTVGAKTKALVSYGQSESGAFWLNRDDWQGTVVNRDEHFVKLARSSYGESTFKAHLSEYSDAALADTTSRISPEPDMLLIDVAGPENRVLKQALTLRPRIVSILYNASYLPYADYDCECPTDFVWDRTRKFSASLKTLNTTAQDQGYVLIGCNSIGTMAYFVRDDLAQDHFPKPGNVAFHYRAPKYCYGHFGHPKKLGMQSNLQRYKERVGRSPIFREGSVDYCVWDSAAIEYPTLPTDLVADDIVIDIGAHIGSFSAWAALHGAAKILAFEANTENFELAKENLSPFNHCTLENCAVWRSDTHEGATLEYNPCVHGQNTGGGNVLLSNSSDADEIMLANLPEQAQEFFTAQRPDHFLESHTILSRPLDDILKEHDQIRFLKIDVEGSEFPILYTSSELQRVQQIAGEYHEHSEEQVSQFNPQARIEGKPYTMAELARHLKAQGFWVIWNEQSTNLGLFLASRTTDRKEQKKLLATFGPFDHSEGKIG